MTYSNEYLVNGLKGQTSILDIMLSVPGKLSSFEACLSDELQTLGV